MTPNTPSTGEEAGALAVAMEIPLPCCCGMNPRERLEHRSDCPAHYRPAVLALITREKNAAVEQERERLKAADAIIDIARTSFWSAKVGKLIEVYDALKARDGSHEY